MFVFLGGYCGCFDGGGDSGSDCDCSSISDRRRRYGVFFYHGRKEPGGASVVP